jgi:hypothetical protein
MEQAVEKKYGDRMKAIPKKVMGLGGWITVKVVPGLTHKKKKVSGLWNARTRTISILAGELPREMRHTLYHELTHAAIYDSGQHNLLSEEGNEALCDMMAMARLREEGL